MARRTIGVFVITAVSLTGWASEAGALTQPGSDTVIPQIVTPSPNGCDVTSATGTNFAWGNVQECLDDHEQSLGGVRAALHAQNHAHVDQETFEPQCQLRFKVVQRGGDYRTIFGWYPAVAEGSTTPPPLSDLHVMLMGCDGPDGRTFTQIPPYDPCPAGPSETVLQVPPGTGKVGFFIAHQTWDHEFPLNPDDIPGSRGTPAIGPTADCRVQFFFSQKSLNPAGLYYVLQWQSLAQPEGFYFGWEDNRCASDNDFEDLLTFVTGVECSGGGAACTVSDQRGRCAEGRMQCRGGGLECVQVNDAVAEVCNAVDDDCDDVIDDEDEGAICPAKHTCYRGNCVPNCAGGEFPCSAGFDCDTTANVCVESTCLGKTCPEGQLCRDGVCQGECVGVTCPYGHVCRHGSCVDVCLGLECDEGFACAVQYPDGFGAEAVGVCSSCSCKGCPEGQTCVSDVCVPSECADVVCAAGQHCEPGAGCVDNCSVGGTQAACPSGQLCANGQCVQDPNATGTGGGSADGGIIDIPINGSGGTTGAGASGAGAASGFGSRDVAEGSSCGCRTLGARTTASGLAASMLALLAVAYRRRKRGLSRRALR